MPAFYDPVRDEIIGAEPGSLPYLHEKGHQWLNRKLHYYGLMAWAWRALPLLAIWALSHGTRADGLIARGIVTLLLVWEALDELAAWLLALWWDTERKRHI